jgi:hypothetical protein
MLPEDRAAWWAHGGQDELGWARFLTAVAAAQVGASFTCLGEGRTRGVVVVDRRWEKEVRPIPSLL